MGGQLNVLAQDQPAAAAAQPVRWQERWYRNWLGFWFRPADPTLLGLIRISCGVLALYTVIGYCFDLQAFLGGHAWLDASSRLDQARNRPIINVPLSGNASPPVAPRNPQEQRYQDSYITRFKHVPPGPQPRNDEEQYYCIRFREQFGWDLRVYGLPPPQNQEQKNYLERVMKEYGQPPAPPYPRDAQEAEANIDYMVAYKADPNRLLAKGMPIWSLWFHVTDPDEMKVLQGVCVAVMVLFLLGCCTRLTAPLAWFVNLSYIHRAPEVQFGADTMMNILLLYLAIGPSGAALSVDRLLSRWWSGNKPRVINGWRRLWGRAPLAAQEIRPARYSAQPEPLVGANLAVRLLQVHLCIIYLVAGLAKLLGTAWWNGTAIWGAIANPEFAPMQFEIYNDALRFLGHNDIVFTSFLLSGTYFTLAFEIGYAFLIWSPHFRWLLLAAAFFLHGLIGTLMGLQTFALIMVVMNMAFLRDREAHWLVNRAGWLVGITPWAAEASPAKEAVAAAAEIPRETTVKVKQKK